MRVTSFIISCLLITLLFGCNSGKIDESKPESSSANYNSSTSTGLSSSASSSSEKPVILRKEPYSGNDNYIPSSSVGESSNEQKEIFEQNLIKQRNRLYMNLGKELSDYDYSWIEYTYGQDGLINGLIIRVVNQENVEKLFSKLVIKNVKIEYKQAKYSKGYLSDVKKILDENELIKSNSNIFAIQVLPMRDCINIVIKDDYPELAQWIEQSEYKDFVKLSKSLLKTNPS